jgi:hypothetical protein
MTRVPGVSLGFSLKRGCEKRHSFAWIFLRPNRQIALNILSVIVPPPHCTPISNLNSLDHFGLEFSPHWWKLSRTSFTTRLTRRDRPSWGAQGGERSFEKKMRTEIIETGGKIENGSYWHVVCWIWPGQTGTNPSPRFMGNENLAGSIIVAIQSQSKKMAYLRFFQSHLNVRPWWRGTPIEVLLTGTRGYPDGCIIPTGKDTHSFLPDRYNPLISAPSPVWGHFYPYRAK